MLTAKEGKAEANWKRLKQSAAMDYGGELPARVVPSTPLRTGLEHDEADHSYRTFLETVSDDGKPGVKAARYFYWEEEALEDYRERLGMR
jgi:hypothetical protein